MHEMKAYKFVLSDVAIAAPYEDEGRGVVYIYHGSPSGLTDPAKQRITGRSLDLGLRGFGWSISRGLDVDGNGYKGNYSMR